MTTWLQYYDPYYYMKPKRPKSGHRIPTFAGLGDSGYLPNLPAPRLSPLPPQPGAKALAGIDLRDIGIYAWLFAVGAGGWWLWDRYIRDKKQHKGGSPF